MSGKKLDTLIPSFLDQKSKTRKQLRFAEGFGVASYENSGTVNICHFPTKKTTRLEISSTFVIKHIDVKGTRILLVTQLLSTRYFFSCLSERFPWRRVGS